MKAQRVWSPFCFPLGASDGKNLPQCEVVGRQLSRLIAFGHLARRMPAQSICVALSSNEWKMNMIPTLLDKPAEVSSPARQIRLTRARRTAILKALADPRRFELLERIAKAGCPLGCAQALAALPISAATLSHHIKELETAGIIDVRREGKFHFLTIRPGVLQAVASLVGSLESAPCESR